MFFNAIRGNFRIYSIQLGLHIKLRLNRFLLNELHSVRKHVYKTWSNMSPQKLMSRGMGFPTIGICDQQSLRSACANAQSDQNLC